MRVGRLREKDRGHGHVNVSTVEIEAVARRNDQTDRRSGAAKALHLLDHSRQCGFRGAGAEDEKKLFFDIIKIAKDREPIKSGDRSQDNDDEKSCRQIETK